jgi:2-C-methyl-D-erythritol 2,4-cyclodiphosphate synthase
MRIGHGFDAHRFQAGGRLILGGVEIPHSHSLEGHSDADVVIHALCDALLGAAALGDLGQHFPPGEATWRGADSRVFLRKINALLAAKNYSVSNIDVTIIAESPKLAPYREQMRANLAADLTLAIDQVSVKATTTEGMGFTGRKEGIAAQAVVLINSLAVI